ncbi:hypothetical protein J31TS4_44010 [Paenibacillus sp. J31TS4]|uniref:DUF58 domain-containing protein n=1 Tax=Paenibacillus sp. J31TS4 TaxID=2807195 RepID=UPI001B0A4F6A|nr:DUF58 domain-containing protein [Paenibacillus sp. J31TS4]GIP41121.1 hypothetical protein J31TS4_44010 [Paenibacillus sp. J31TS4]
MERVWNAGATAIAAAAGLALYASGAGGAAGAAGFGLAALLLAAAGHTAGVLRSCTLARAVHEGAAGQESGVHVTVTLRHRSLVPLPWLVIRDGGRNERTGEEIAVRLVLFPWFSREVRAVYELRGLARGSYVLDGLEAAAGDCLGLLQRTSRSPEAARFLVYPEPAPLFWKEEPAEAGTDSSAALPASFGDPGLALRDYAPGDALRQISWKATAKAGRLISRSPEERRPEGLLLLLDGSLSGESSHDGEEALERRIRIAAGLLREAEQAGTPAGLAVPGRDAFSLPPDSQRPNDRLWRTLAVLEPAEGGLGFAELVVRVGLGAPAAAVTCITSRIDEELAASIRLLRSRRRPLMLIFVPPGGGEAAERAQIWLEHLESLGCPFLVWGRRQEEEGSEGGGHRAGYARV